MICLKRLKIQQTIDSLSFSFCNGPQITNTASQSKKRRVGEEAPTLQKHTTVDALFGLRLLVISDVFLHILDIWKSFVCGSLSHFCADAAFEGEWVSLVPSGQGLHRNR